MVTYAAVEEWATRYDHIAAIKIKAEATCNQWAKVLNLLALQVQKYKY
jgi:hypothetical protein